MVLPNLKYCIILGIFSVVCYFLAYVTFALTDKQAKHSLSLHKIFISYNFLIALVVYVVIVLLLMLSYFSERWNNRFYVAFYKFLMNACLPVVSVLIGKCLEGIGGVGVSLMVIISIWLLLHLLMLTDDGGLTDTYTAIGLYIISTLEHYGIWFMVVGSVIASSRHISIYFLKNHYNAQADSATPTPTPTSTSTVQSYLALGRMTTEELRQEERLRLPL